ncbi:hypothetical protein AB5I41_08440 [Sphingomonas sp. MMS24-JH45]
MRDPERDRRPELGEEIDRRAEAAHAAIVGRRYREDGGVDAVSRGTGAGCRHRGAAGTQRGRDRPRA